MTDSIIEKPAAPPRLPSKASPASHAREKADMVMQTRISRKHREIIDKAAEARGVSRSTFVVETLLEKSEKVLLDTLLFHLDPVQTAALEEIFDNPPSPTEALCDLMASTAPWE